MSEQTLTEAGAEVPQWDVADRLRKALRTADVGAQEMAEHLGVSRNTVGNYLNGRGVPKVQTLRVWALRCGVPYEWLRTGEASTRCIPPRGTTVLRFPAGRATPVALTSEDEPSTIAA